MSSPRQVRPRVTADEVLRALSVHDICRNSFFTTDVRSGPSQGTWNDELGQKIRYFDFDGLAVARSWVHFAITIFEVKVDRQDFLRDVKWPEYRSFCHRLYLVCPKGLIGVEELPADVGLLYYSPETKTIRMQRASAHHKIEVPWELLVVIIFSHLSNDRYPFFSSKRDYFERWMQEGELNREFSYRFKGVLEKRIQEAARAQESANRQIEAWKSEVERLRKAERVLNANGVRLDQWKWDEELDARLKGGIPRDLRQQVTWIGERAAEILRKLPEGAEHP